jgi:hypothetical protein
MHDSRALSQKIIQQGALVCALLFIGAGSSDNFFRISFKIRSHSLDLPLGFGPERRRQHWDPAPELVSFVPGEGSVFS